MVDLTFCPTCGSALLNPTGSYTRKTENVADGLWTKTEWTIMRRYCELPQATLCKPPSVLPKGLFRTTIM
ncbi:MAG: hypothetical protein F4202_03260 [Cenarchaeum sp. SB0677_bin_16]|nr:hypothetical protein [Cenarchaeum sp. SB0662_bin_33]MYG33004.1 hypothetical protein [Cenarchaeum sp. SB0677_bin_16]